SYDHQSKTYVSSFKPLTLSGVDINVTPYFSPDHSAEMLVKIIDGAKKTLDIYTPGFSSWQGCSPYSGCGGCNVSVVAAEPFPVFPALLNAVHRGVAVRIITNDYNVHTCEGVITPLDYLKLNGVDIRYYTSTTFMHSKVLVRDGVEVSIGSVNWTKNSILNDREAAMFFTGTNAAADLAKYVLSVYEQDWAQTYNYTLDHTYSPQDMAIITNTSLQPVNVPQGPDRPYITPEPSAISVNTDVEIWTSPDYAYTTIMEDIDSAETSFALYIYQVTDKRLCEKLINVTQAGLNLTLLVSYRIYGTTDYELAKSCYETLYQNGVVIRSAYAFTYSFYNHQKFWIADGKRVTLATGNWSPSDYPGPPGSYPVFGQEGWQSVNRDFTVRVANKDVVDVFDKVLTMDYLNGTYWKPY
ncbi:uncharacterized protein MONBRDRAFT_1366, partial [Monosiga brevicollis MX1]